MKRIWIITIVISLLFASLGCIGLSRKATPPTDLPPIATATPIPPTRTPLPMSDMDTLQTLESQVAAVYAATDDAVVNIAVTTLSYDFFFRAYPQEGSGSGFVYDDQGHIITNFHVIEGAEDIQVTFADGVTLPASVVGYDATYDLAVLRIDPQSHPTTSIPLGDSGALQVGQFVVAIGNPFGLKHSATFGIISSLGRVIQSPDERFIGEVIQTDAAINPGNSGGPLLDLQGRVIGVNAQIVSNSQDNAGIGFAIPANIVRRVVPELIANGHYQHSWMGISYFGAGLSASLAQSFAELGVTVPDSGLLLLSVDVGAPAERAGLRGGNRVISLRSGRLPVGGDVIQAIDGTLITNPRDFIAYLETDTQPGDTVQVTVWRDGETLTLPVTLEGAIAP